VQECLASAEQPPPSPMNELDACILSAASEDEVQACLQSSEARAAAFETMRTGLAECIRAAGSEDEMEACLVDADMA